MIVAVISDAHANLEALTAVLADADRRGANTVWCTGDIVGYGPDPSAVIAELRHRDAVLVAGNHDLAACGKMGVEDFNDVAAAAALWTLDILSDPERAFLAALPMTSVQGDFTLVHGTLRHPEWEYLLRPDQAVSQFELQSTLYSIVGHTHLPMIVREEVRPQLRRLESGAAITLDAQRLILNPGGCGQPRDGDPTAPYMLYDQESATITHHRVPYDIAATQDKIRRIGLPEWLAARLADGI
jgi:diadenosine tetraphosphatase ApaH/serine/threonine PP2A family protein phosphatase